MKNLLKIDNYHSATILFCYTMIAFVTLLQVQDVFCENMCQLSLLQIWAIYPVLFFAIVMALNSIGFVKNII